VIFGATIKDNWDEWFHSRSGKALWAKISKGDAVQDAFRALFFLIKEHARALIKKDA
jgi:hypothetical protein